MKNEIFGLWMPLTASLIAKWVITAVAMEDVHMEA